MAFWDSRKKATFFLIVYYYLTLFDILKTIIKCISKEILIHIYHVV